MATRDKSADRRDRPSGDPTARRDDLAGAERKLEEVLATLRDSDVDLRDYMPDMATILREAHPGRAEEKLRQASLTPLPFELGANGQNKVASPTEGTPARGSAPSPWAKGAATPTAIDKTALPSATMPAAAPPPAAAGGVTSAPVAQPPAQESPQPARRLAIVKGVGAVIAVFTPLLLMYALLVSPSGDGHGGASTIATAAPMATPPAAVTAPPSAAPVLSVGPVEPTAVPTVSATALPAPSVAPPIMPSVHRPGAGLKQPMRNGAAETSASSAPPPSPQVTAPPSAASTATVPPELLH